MALDQAEEAADLGITIWMKMTIIMREAAGGTVATGEIETASIVHGITNTIVINRDGR